MDANTGEIKFLTDAQLKEFKGFKPLPVEGSVIRFEGTEFCFRIKKITPFKVILKPVSASEYKP